MCQIDHVKLLGWSCGHIAHFQKYQSRETCHDSVCNYSTPVMVTVHKPVSDRWAEPDLLRFGLGPGAYHSTVSSLRLHWSLVQLSKLFMRNVQLQLNSNCLV